LLGALIVLAALHIHGFSLPYWHKLLDRSPADEVLFGEARKIRIDDWAVHLPFALSQGAQSPGFPVHSDLIAYGGMDMRVGFPVPVADWVTLFRPQLWGYFAGNDFGLAWHWWFRVLALYLAGFLAFRILAAYASSADASQRSTTAFAAVAAVALVAAPFFQFWSFSYEPHVAASLLAFVAIAGVARAPSLGGMLGWGALLCGAAGWFALGLIYPPHQITLAYLTALVTGLWLWRERAAILARGSVALRIGVAVTALAAAALAVGTWYVRSSKAIQLVSGTIYPGGRFDSGGDLSLLRLLNNYFTLFLGEDSLREFQNISEGSAFLFLSPLILAVIALEWIGLRRKPEPLILWLGGFQALLAVYGFLGFPRVLAQTIFLGRLPAQRVILALGVADLLIVVLYLAGSARRIGRTRWAEWAIVAAWAAGLFALGMAIAARVESAGPLGIALIALLFMALAALVVFRSRFAIAALALLSVACTAWFNPVVRGGSGYLTENPLAQAILTLDRSEGGGTRWVVFNDPRLSNLFRAIGVRSVGGVHYYPQVELWRRLGLYERAAEQWNRYANVQFALKERGGPLGLQLPFLDQLVVRVHPDHPAFAALEADFLLYVGPDRHVLDDASALAWETSVGDAHIFRVALQRGASSMR